MEFQKFLDTQQKPKPIRKVSFFGLKAYQLKNIIEQYNLAYPDKAIIGYKSKTIDILDGIIKKAHIKIPDFKIVYVNPYTPPPNIYKKAGINQYDEENQKTYQLALTNNTRHKNPLQSLGTYTNKEGIKEYLTPQKHQKDFITSFIYSSLKGCVLFHGVGSGKTLSAVIASYYYLKLYPKNKVIVISPSALLFNFVAGMVQYGLDKNDNRYSFFTYDKYCRNPKQAKDSLLIVDEAHNFRTQIQFRTEKDPNNPANTTEKAVTNSKGYKIMEWGSNYCHKILLLTGTAFVNILYDIENLLAMVDNRKPVNKDCYDDITSRVDSVLDYFNYKISYYKTLNTDGFFPDRIEKLLPIVMTEEQESKYNSIKSSGQPNNQSENPNSFYSAEKYASNMIDNKNNPKIKFIVEEIVKTKTQKFIVYSGLYDNGIMMIAKELEKNKIKFTFITGKQNTMQKEDSKNKFNYYNFGDKNFFDIKTIDPIYHKDINSEFRVLLITRAGAEGVDTINCNNIILLDGQWNDALSEQIIARAIRFKSHFGLPKAQRFVNVLRPILIFKSNEELVKAINNNKIDFNKLKEQIKGEVSEQLKLIKGVDGRYLPTIKEMKSLKSGTAYFVPGETKYTTIKGMWGRSSKTVQSGVDGWDKYNILTTKEQRESWLKHMYYKYLESQKIVENDPLLNSMYSIDLYLYIISKAKQATIDGFISYFGKSIQLYEGYESLFIKRIKIKEKELKRDLTEEEKIKILNAGKKEEMNTILKFDETLMVSKKTKRNNKNELQQFYTNSKLSEYLLNYSSLKKNKSNMINILEPSAGEGDLIKPIILSNTNIKITLVEFDPINRKTLLSLVNKAPLLLEISNQHNFLLFQSSSRFDYIFMNPPFHLRKSEDYNLICDVWDYDFIKRAFAFLNIGGELMAIISTKFLSNNDFMKWIQNKNKSLVYEIRKNEKFSGIKIDIAVLKLEKKSEEEDSMLLSHNFYIKQDTKGTLIMNNELKINLKPDTQPMKKIDLEALRKANIPTKSELEELDEELTRLING